MIGNKADLFKVGSMHFRELFLRKGTKLEVLYNQLWTVDCGRLTI